MSISEDLPSLYTQCAATPTSAVWSAVTTLPKDSLTYIDNISVCAAWLNYRVKLITDNCSFISNIDGGYIQDQLAPDPPVIQYVTNDTSNNELIVHWSPSNAQDVSAYIVFKSVDKRYISFVNNYT